MKTKLSAALTAIFLTASMVSSQERWQADVRVRSVTVVQVGARLTCKVVVYSDNDDDARQTTVRILMPVGVKFLSSATGCIASPSAAADGTQGVATCNIGTLPVGASSTVQIVTTVPTIPGISKSFGAFAWSITPDPRPANNYGEGTAP